MEVVCFGLENHLRFSGNGHGAQVRGWPGRVLPTFGQAQRRERHLQDHGETAGRQRRPSDLPHQERSGGVRTHGRRGRVVSGLNLWIPREAGDPGPAMTVAAPKEPFSPPPTDTILGYRATLAIRGYGWLFLEPAWAPGWATHALCSMSCVQ
jgi:hypothetical protein